MPATRAEEWSYWDAKATEVRRSQLTTVRASAVKWSALLTALLGAFGAVAFAGGLTTVDKLDDPWNWIAKAITSAAALLSVAAIVLFAQVSDGLSPRTVSGVTAASVMSAYTTGAAGALNWFRRARNCAIAAAALVLAGSTIILWVGAAEADPKPPSVAAVVDGRLVCGALGRSSTGDLTIGKAAISGQITDLVVMDACPK